MPYARIYVGCDGGGEEKNIIYEIGQLFKAVPKNIRIGLPIENLLLAELLD